MKKLSEHLGELIVAIAGLAFFISTIMVYKAPVGDFIANLTGGLGSSTASVLTAFDRDLSGSGGESGGGEENGGGAGGESGSETIKAPVLAAGDKWWNTTQNNVQSYTYRVNTIYIFDTVSDYIISSSYSSWPAAADANGDGVNDDDIMCYRAGSSSSYTIYICGNGAGKIIANANSSNAFGSFKDIMIYNLDLLDTSNVEDMSYMFYNTQEAENYNFSNFTTTNATNMHGMFMNAAVFDSADTGGDWEGTIDLSGFDTSKVTDMGYMFYGCEAFSSLDVSGFDTSVVTDMGYMFNSCGVRSLDLSNFDTRTATNLNGFANYCGFLTNIQFGTNFGQSSNVPYNNMFYYGGGTQLTTQIYNANSVMKNYNWNLDMRYPTFRTY